MFSGLTTLSRTVAALFAPPFLFSVPSYQRSYSWTLREAAQLLEDVATAAGMDGGEAEPDYFLGAILLLGLCSHAIPLGQVVMWPSRASYSL